MPDEDKNFGGSLFLDFRKWLRHVKTIYSMVEVLFRLQATRAKHGEMWPVFCAGKDEIRVKRGKKCNWCHAREKGEHEPGVKRGKTCNRCYARENMEAVLSAENHATGVICGKLHVS